MDHGPRVEDGQTLSWRDEKTFRRAAQTIADMGRWSGWDTLTDAEKRVVHRGAPKYAREQGLPRDFYP